MKSKNVTTNEEAPLIKLQQCLRFLHGKILRYKMQIIVAIIYILTDWKYFTAQNTKLIHELRVRLY